jgi:predicted XRE-type DNA-binding protein
VVAKFGGRTGPFFLAKHLPEEETMLKIKHKKPNRKLKAILELHSISQSQAALDLGIERARFNACVNGWIQPSSSVRKRISEYTGVPENEIWG